jgi:hypothetical protein
MAENRRKRSDEKEEIPPAMGDDISNGTDEEFDDDLESDEDDTDEVDD